MKDTINNSKRIFNDEKFANPGKEYRGLPFWAWNAKMEPQKMTKEVDTFKEMGFGGIVDHARNGLQDRYMGESFLNAVAHSVEEAKEKNLDVWLYDEDRWPSGCSGGYVTENRCHRKKAMIFTFDKFDHALEKEEGIKQGRLYLLTCFDVTFSEDGYLTDYREVEEHDGCLRVYIDYEEDSLRYNYQAYADVLSEDAMQRFLETTYEPYYERFGDEFGNRIKAIFTDEPQITRKEMATFSKINGFKQAVLPWTTDFDDTYLAEYGERIIPKLPEVIFELPNGKYSVSRYRFHEHMAARFRKTFSQKIGAWCREHGIAFTGHFMLEQSLEDQAFCDEDVMRHYHDFDIPGIDILCGYHEYTTAKQCQSVVHQDGKNEFMSELYGVTNWDADFRDYLEQGNWQAALGVNIRVPHLTWYTMKGNGKRDYPACFGYQAPWAKEFPRIEDYFARVNTVTSAGTPKVSIAVLHPIESYWLVYGANDKPKARRKARDNDFQNLCKTLLFNLQDFDYINEALLPEQYHVGSGSSAVGAMKYDVVLVPDCITIRKTTLEILEDMQKNGVRVIFAGGIPTLQDGVESSAPAQFAAKCEQIPYSEDAILQALEPYRTVDVLMPTGMRSTNLIHSERIIDGDLWVFVTTGMPIQDKTRPTVNAITVKVKGKYTPVFYDAMTGKTFVPTYTVGEESTEIICEIGEFDSILLRLMPAEKASAYQMPAKATKAWTPLRVPSAVSITREEPNVCLLEMAEYSFDGEHFEEEEEILHIDRICRKKYNLQPVMGKDAAQPWSVTNINPHPIWLRYTFNCACPMDVKLAFEDLEFISVNGVEVKIDVDGSFVDDDIRTITLPTLKAGENVIVAQMTTSNLLGIEPMYILGDFDVDLRGTALKLLPASTSFGFGNVVEQGMPFYGGNLKYETKINVPADGDLKICVNNYRGDLYKVFVDGKEIGTPFLPPYTATASVNAGEHTVGILLYGNRNNTFGSLHCMEYDLYVGSRHWYKTGTSFSYDYLLKPMGVLSRPLVEWSPKEN